MPIRPAPVIPRLQSSDPVFNRFQDYLRQTLTVLSSSEQEPWIAPDLMNGWTNLSDTDSQLGFYKDSNGIVHLRGHAANGSIGSTIFVLPIGYRPSHATRVPVVSNGAFGYCRIVSAGDVTAAAGSAAWFSLDGITFDTR